MSDTTVHDPTTFLHGQHEEVKQLFEQLTTASADRAGTFQCLVRLLAVHETAEEEVIYPAVRSKVENGDSLVEPRLEEESKAKQMLSDLEKLGVDGPGFDQQLATFRDAVLSHAEAEESNIFPALRSGMNAEEGQKMASALETAEKMAPTHPHPHGPESALGNMVVGPFVAIADRTRDALRNRG